MCPTAPLVLIDNEDQTDARLNLALEEYIVRRYDVSAGAFCLFYVNAPSVIIGKHQNVWEEVNVGFCRRRGIPILRRISGGGAVYHDHGNLNISFVTRRTMQNFNNYRSFLQPVVEALGRLRVRAAIDERNNIVIGGKKISGNAQFTSRETLLSHGTLLFDSDLPALREALQTDRSGIISSKGTRSTPASVTNVAKHLNEPLSISAFRNHLLQSFALEGHRPLRLKEDEWNEVKRLAGSKYGDWEWNYGRSPACVIAKRIRLAGEEFKVHLHIDKGRIAEIHSPDKNVPSVFRELQNALNRLPYTYDALSMKMNELQKKDSRKFGALSGLLENL